MLRTVLNLGAWRHIDGTEGGEALLMPAQHLVTHAVVLGMTGSGKTGFVTVLVEEALSAGVPAIIIDVKGDLPNLLLTYPSFEPDFLRPWVEKNADEGPSSGATQLAAQLSQERQKALSVASIGEPELQKFSDGISVRVITPGASAGESLHVLSALERRSARWDSDPESARNALSAAVSLVLRLLGRDPDPAKSREHVLLSVLAERRLAMGQAADISTLMQDLTDPPIAQIGALAVNSFLKKRERCNLAAALNTLLASPTFCSCTSFPNCTPCKHQAAGASAKPSACPKSFLQYNGRQLCPKIIAAMNATAIRMHVTVIAAKPEGVSERATSEKYPYSLEPCC
jgi:hypothetical protein